MFTRNVVYTDSLSFHYTSSYTEDPWLWALDWSVQDIRVKKLKPPKKRKTKTSNTADGKQTGASKSVGERTGKGGA